MHDPEDPNLITRVRAVLHGERSAAPLEALRRAGGLAVEELVEAERARAELAVGGRDLWQAQPAVGGQLVATWNAFVLHTLAAALLDADYADQPGTVGYVPPVTYQQAWAWFGAVEGWLSAARQARSNPEFDLSSQVRLPAGLPPWAEVEPCPPAHLAAMRAAIPQIREHAELAVFDLEKAGVPDGGAATINRLKQLLAEAGSAADYAARLAGGRIGEQVHELIEDNLKHAVEIWFHVGQLAALPVLVEHYPTRGGAARPDLDALPGGSRFDPWCLTDPVTLPRWKADPRARRAMDLLWRYDPDPVKTLTIQAQIQQGLDSGGLAFHRTRSGASCYFCCPWASLYQVRRPVTIAGKRLAPMQQFTFEVSAEEMAEGGPFVRRVVLGPFQPTDDVDYCDPTTGGHDD
jgi:hypothetical protein